MHFLKVPFKQAEPISFSKPLKDAIEQTFDEDSQSYQDDIQTLETLRLSCQDPQVHDASAGTLCLYNSKSLIYHTTHSYPISNQSSTYQRKA